jgi:hypothetical protein
MRKERAPPYDQWQAKRETAGHHRQTPANDHRAQRAWTGAERDTYAELATAAIHGRRERAIGPIIRSSSAKAPNTEPSHASSRSWLNARPASSSKLQIRLTRARGSSTAIPTVQHRIFESSSKSWETLCEEASAA